MMRALWTAGSGMLAQQLNIDTIANNLANVNTTGFKKGRVEFQDLLYQTIKSPGVTQDGQMAAGLQVGLGVRPVTIQRLFDQGNLQATNNPLDLAIEGEGFFQVVQENGSLAYTRDGSFKLSSEGDLVTADGLKLEPNINIPAEATDINVAKDGTVSYKINGQVETAADTIKLYRFANRAGLESIGRNLFVPTAASGEATEGTPGQEGFGTLNGGYLEMSNVQVVEEMVNMIVAQRAYEVNTKAVQAADEMLGQANALKR